MAFRALRLVRREAMAAAGGGSGAPALLQLLPRQRLAKAPLASLRTAEAGSSGGARDSDAQLSCAAADPTRTASSSVLDSNVGLASDAQLPWSAAALLAVRRKFSSGVEGAGLLHEGTGARASVEETDEASQQPAEAGRYAKGLSSSVDAREVAKFSALANSWWNARGPHGGLHAMNPVRVSFLRSAMCRHFGRDAEDAQPLAGLHVLDVGCGGGLLCEPLARMGAHVTGVDAAERNVRVAAVHAARDVVTASIEYIASTAEQLADEGRQFDAVLALEVVEHVKGPGDFVQSLANLCKAGGVIGLSTINRTLRSYALAIVAAEQLLGWLPRGTHQWDKFLTPSEVALMLRRADFQMEELAGMTFDPIRQTWGLDSDTSVNYIAISKKLM